MSALLPPPPPPPKFENKYKIGVNKLDKRLLSFSEKVKRTYDFNVDPSLSAYWKSEFSKVVEDPTYKGKFNLFAWLFGSFWLLSKGMWKNAIGLLFAIGFVDRIIQSIFGDAVPNSIGIGINFGFAAIFGQYATRLYFIKKVTGEEPFFKLFNSKKFWNPDIRVFFGGAKDKISSGVKWNTLKKADIVATITLPSQWSIHEKILLPLLSLFIINQFIAYESGLEEYISPVIYWLPNIFEPHSRSLSLVSFVALINLGLAAVTFYQIINRIVFHSSQKWFLCLPILNVLPGIFYFEQIVMAFELVFEDFNLIVNIVLPLLISALIFIHKKSFSNLKKVSDSHLPDSTNIVAKQKTKVFLVTTVITFLFIAFAAVGGYFIYQFKKFEGLMEYGYLTKPPDSITIGKDFSITWEENNIEKDCSLESGGIWAKRGECTKNFQSCRPGTCTQGDCENGYGKMTFPSGGFFFGDFKDGEFTGSHNIMIFCGDNEVRYGGTSNSYLDGLVFKLVPRIDKTRHDSKCIDLSLRRYKMDELVDIIEKETKCFESGVGAVKFQMNGNRGSFIPEK